jgi:hypothetical protein
MTRRSAQPLSLAEADELRAEGLGSTLVEVDGQLYSEDDVFRCEDCGAPTPDRPDLDDDGRCLSCAALAEQEAKAAKELRSDYYAGRL